MDKLNQKKTSNNKGENLPSSRGGEGFREEKYISNENPDKKVIKTGVKKIDNISFKKSSDQKIDDKNWGNKDRINMVSTKGSPSVATHVNLSTSSSETASLQEKKNISGEDLDKNALKRGVKKIDNISFKRSLDQKSGDKNSKNRNEIETPPDEDSSSAQKLILGFLGFGAFLVLAFYGIVFWGTVSGDASNPLFETIGVNASGLKSLLITMTITLFGFVSLILLILTLISLFRGVMAHSRDTRKKSLLIKAGIQFLIFISVVGLWIFAYWFIDNLNAGPVVETKQMLIKTKPDIVIDLDTPVRVEFDITEGLSAITPTEFVRQINWDFDEDGIYDASGPKVSHRFLDKGLNNGIYNVKATILYFSEKKGEVLTGETTRQVIINNESVLAVLTPSPQTGTFPLTVEFSALESRDPDGKIVWYEWDLDGDGIFEERREDPIIHKTFETVGDHKVALRVTGTNTDDFDVIETIISVKNPEGTLRGDINTDGVSEGLAPLKILFDGSNSFVKEGKIVRYEWLVDNEKEAFVGRKMQRIFREPGEHIVTLIIENDIGEKHETKKIITVLEEDQVVDINIRTTPARLKDQSFLRGIVPFEVTFDSKLSRVKNAFEWHWDFQNDGIVDEFGQVAKHIFRKPGVYDVKLTIIDADEKEYEMIQKVIVERSGAIARINANPGAGDVPLSIKFDGSGSSTDDGIIVDYIWEFPGIKPIHYGAKISYLFKQIGNFPVKLTILTSTGKQSTVTTVISAREPHIKADFNYNPKVGNAPLLVTVNPIISAGIVKEYFWDFGDGQVQKQLRIKPIEHLYRKPGKYTIKLRLTDENGVISESEKIVEVRPK